MKSAEIIREFEQVFGDSRRVRVSRGPGRVNLIGEHTDYNDGYVLPMAISRAVWIAGRRRNDRRIRLHSSDFGEMAERSLDDLERRGPAHWSDYFVGVMWALREIGANPEGVEAVVLGDVPQGAGLSSSAAYEVSAGVLLNDLFSLALEQTALVRLAQRAENGYVGVQCGIMDQFASGLGVAGSALQIDCRTLEYRPVALPRNYVVAVADTGVRRGLVGSEYNARRRECEMGVSILREVMPGVRALRDVQVEDLERWKDRFPDTTYRRCEHVVAENRRVSQAVLALERGDVSAFGRFMNASHASLRDLYEVSCRALDIMVGVAGEIDGVAGSRMTGAGFGGCTVSLVHRDAAPEFVRRVPGEYCRRMPGPLSCEPAVYLFDAAPGAGIVEKAQKG